MFRSDQSYGLISKVVMLVGMSVLLARGTPFPQAGTTTTGPVVVFKIDAQKMKVSHYVKDFYRDAAGIKLVGEAGWAQCRFKGAPGVYDVRVRYADSPEGTGSMALYVNNQKQDSWELDRKYPPWTTHLTRNVQLKSDDVLRLEATGDGKELARLESLTVSTPYTFQRIDEGINRTPPMGWCEWNFSHMNRKYLGNDPSGKPYDFNEDYIKAVADALVSKGLRDLGYKWLMIPNNNLRDESGVLRTVWPNRYPRGYEPAINYFHARGLKALLYTDGGSDLGCFPDQKGNQGGNFQHEQLDADTFADWGADGLKMDWCSGQALKLVPHEQYARFSQAMLSAANRVGRPLQLEICSWGVDNTYQWGYKWGSFWRTSGDIDIWKSSLYRNEIATGGQWEAMLRNLEDNRHPEVAGPDKGWNFADMLEVGVPGGLNETEERAMFGLWCLEASPLQLSLDIVHEIPAGTWDVIANPEVIAVDQDSLGKQGDKVKVYGAGDPVDPGDGWIGAEVRENNLEVWSKPLRDGSRAVGLFNKTKAAASITVNWTDLGLASDQRAKVRDLWAHKDLGEFTGSYTTTVEAHGLGMFKITPGK